MDFETGGQAAIFRMVEAYGVSTRQAVCDRLGISKSTMASRFMRDIFPADWIIQCAFDTGASLKWLVTGEGNKFDNEFLDTIKVPRLKLIDGNVHNANYQLFDKVMIADSISKPAVLADESTSYLIDLSSKELTDGLWLIDIDGKASLRKIMRIPGQKVRVSTDESTFDCGIDDVKFIAKVDTIFQKA
ncbi:phage repressor protein CI [Yersinia enterocolitica]|uniref:phage repressor protein CI n=1 Tax=Yersinia rochesterensis TaxID=1604335 RepID=UPI0028535054|nr:phage repressor protein CI [Yersinia rochesterensis]MDR5018465.1 phage repressor protein CI [Yersinia rochesterensis]